MFKRLLKKDTEKPSARSGIFQDSNTEAQGFLCPTCMKNLPSAEALQKHFDTEHNASAPTADSGEGFVCPMCRKSLSSPEDLQNHYEEAHEHKGSENRDGDVFALRREIEELRKALADQGGRQGKKSSKPLSEEDIDELEMMKLQLKGSEEARTLLGSEVHHLQTKKASPATVNAKAKADEYEGQKSALEDHLKSLKEQIEAKERYAQSLETQLTQRPGTEDVVVLKKELISVQTLMDKVALEQEREKEAVQQKCDQLKKTNISTAIFDTSSTACLPLSEEEITKLKDDLAKAPKEDDIKSIRTRLESWKADLEKSPRLDNYARLETSLQKAEEQLKIYESQTTSKDTEVKALLEKQGQGQEKSEPLNVGRKKEKLLAPEERKMETKMEYRDKKEYNTGNMHGWEYQAFGYLLNRTLLSIEAGEGVETAINQLKDEKAELLLASEAAKASQRADLEDHIKTAQNSLEEKKSELNRVQQQLGKVSPIYLYLVLLWKVSKLEELQQQHSAVQEDLKSTQSTSEERRLELLQVQLDFTQHKESKESEINSMKETNTKLEEKNVSTAEKLKAKKLELETLKESHEEVKLLLSQTNKQVDEYKSQSEELESNLEKEKLDHKNEKQKLEAEVAAHMMEKFESEKKVLTEQQQQKQSECDKLKTNLQEVQKTLEDTQEKLKVTEKELSEKLKELSVSEEGKNKSNTEVGELQAKFTATTADLKQTKEELNTLTKDAQSLKDNCETSETEAIKLEANYYWSSKEKTEQFNQLCKEKTKCKLVVRNAMNAQMVKLDEELQEARSGSEELKKYKEVTEPELEGLKKTSSELKAMNESYESDIQNLKASLDQEKKERHQEVSALEEAKGILITQKVEVQNQLDGMEDKIKQAEDAVQEAKSNSANVQQMLREENSGLQTKLDDREKKCGELERQLEEENARTEMQLSVLNENLGTVRVDLVTAQQQVSELTKLTDELKGEKLELEAKLENSNDERRLLLDRCVKSEGECEKLQQKSLDLKRKVDDMTTALHEMGRENQSLQITTTKVQSRKWADDSEVKDCMACSKKFSVTVRRHHCRHCGNIFCNECSSREAKIAMSKKPVRVCDNCYIDLVKD
ncbi:early endosome antigen 1-like [Ruditapes philippinarum]|uniref:early endosome antigen 1-like n=1 Tax=Ruditapes philippinarum TaxID=129788 RepID=UPI00295C37CD|nr:early endosome antigen 1-like [Ruditapes philippinarum]